jgi:type VI secretion system secreted protein VgrG
MVRVDDGSVRVFGPWSSDQGRRFALKRIDGVEAIGTCFEYTLALDSEDCGLSPDVLLGQRVRVEIELGARGARCLEGIVSELAHVGYVGSGARFKLVLRPSLWLLSRNRDCRVFERQTVPEILTELFANHGLSDVEFRLTEGYRSRVLCVQYLESDLSFAQRLMHEEGLYYFFEHSEGRHVLVVTDALRTHRVAAGQDRVPFRGTGTPARQPGAVMHRWTTRQKLLAARVTLASPALDHRGIDHTHSRVDGTQRARHPVELFDYSATQADFEEGTRQARLRLDELLADYETCEGASDAAALYAGARFALTGAPREVDNRSYTLVAQSFVLDCDHDESQGAAPRYYASLRAQDATRPFRMQQLRKPARIFGAQSARVVDADGCDEGPVTAVRLRFHWDRRAPLASAGSCWAQVFQSPAHASVTSDWPHAGDEVLVEFLDGDPERPVVVGRACSLDEVKTMRDPMRGQPRVLKTQSAAGFTFAAAHAAQPPAADADGCAPAAATPLRALPL